jgi:hypothetical protein
MEHEIENQQCRKILAGTLATLAAVAFSCLAATPPAAAQSPELDRYYAPFEARLAAGEDLQTLTDEIEAPLHDVLAGPPIPVCPAVIPAGGFPGATSRRFYYLSEILPLGIGPNDPFCGAWLGCFLDQVAGTVHDTATLVIDRQCVSRRTLVVPDRFVLAGVGLDGAGRLLFDLPTSTRALRFKPPAALPVVIRHSQIRDLSIGNLHCCGQVGIDLSHSTLVHVENVRVSDFAFGIAGHASYFNTIEGSNLSTNGVGIRQGDDTTTWQMRENAISFSRLAGIGFHATTRASVVSGGVLESNPFGAIFLRGIGNIVQSTWFETNGASNGGFAVRVSAAATDSRILTSLFSNNDILDPSPSTRRCYNTAVGPLIPDNCP